MPKKKGKIVIGTSGWIYKDWDPIFYPPKMPDREKLSFLSHHFPTVEVNSSFYHLPRTTTYEGWNRKTPDNFIFSVKLSRYITHRLRLKAVAKAWDKFIKGPQVLKEKLGPILIQFPPSFKAENITLKRLDQFLKRVRAKHPKLLLACELRHSSWFTESTYVLLRKYGVALVIADSSRFPKESVVTSHFMYVRFHGPTDLFSSNYSTYRLKKAAAEIEKWITEGLNVYVYFNNDRGGHAVKNAQTLTKILSKYTS